jgi:arylsulfatase
MPRSKKQVLDLKTTLVRSWSAREVRGVFVASIAVLCIAACAEDFEQEAKIIESSSRPKSVVLIINDTMRRDRVGIYGGPAKTPAFDAFAERNALFEQAYTPAPWTKPSVASLFTSLYPSQHRVLSHPREIAGVSAPTMPIDVLSDEFDTLAEFLQRSRLHTAAFVANPWMLKEFGFAQGFDVYDDSFAKWEAPGEQVSRAGLDWLEGLPKDEPFFLYLHYIDTHRPYDPLSVAELMARAEGLKADGRPVSKEGRAAIRRVVKLEEGVDLSDVDLRPSLALVELSYDKGLEAFDRALAMFMDEFRQHGMFEHTAIVITSDHGEALFERGYGNHGQGLYSDEVALPFAARFPGHTTPGMNIEAPVSLIDVMPSLFAYLEIEGKQSMAGRSLLTSLRDLDPGRCLVIEGVGGKPKNRAVLKNSYKLLWQPQKGPDGVETALFHIREDPLEANNLLASDETSQEVGTIVTSLLQSATATVRDFDAPEQTTVPLDEATKGRLRALGYLE